MFQWRNRSSDTRVKSYPDPLRSKGYRGPGDYDGETVTDRVESVPGRGSIGIVFGLS